MFCQFISSLFREELFNVFILSSIFPLWMFFRFCASCCRSYFPFYFSYLFLHVCYDYIFLNFISAYFCCIIHLHFFNIPYIFNHFFLYCLLYQAPSPFTSLVWFHWGSSWFVYFPKYDWTSFSCGQRTFQTYVTPLNTYVLAK